MGIDIGHKGLRQSGRRALVSQDPYMAILARLFKFLARRTGAKFNATVYKRLISTRMNRQPVSISRIATDTKGTAGRTAVVVATVTDDERLFEVPKLRIAALKFTEAARARIVQAGGECLTLDQLAQENPTGSNTVILRGRVSHREAASHFGAPGTPGSHAKPYTLSKGRKFEMARGRRASRGYKVKA